MDAAAQPAPSGEHPLTVLALEPSSRRQEPDVPGIDLAADPRRTGLAALRESGGTVLVEQVRSAPTTPLIVETVEAADYVGIDVPRMAARFVDLLSLHAAGTLPAPRPVPSGGGTWRCAPPTGRSTVAPA